jgi:GH15 family glucan-1,4-alpha-glucosidase
MTIGCGGGEKVPADSRHALPLWNSLPTRGIAGIMHIEDYALVGNGRTAALVGRNGSIDWLCWPRFDSPACFAALLGDEGNGRWLIRPAAEARITRHYRPGTAILETCFETQSGKVKIVDFMPSPADERQNDLVRLVVGETGSVDMRMEVLFRFEYGRTVPWVRRRGWGVSAVAGPEEVLLRAPVVIRGEGLASKAQFIVSAGETVPFILTWRPSHHDSVLYREPEDMLRQAEADWHVWAERCTATEPWREAVLRSLITLKLLIYAPTGGMVAAPTTSLPEALGGGRNWDYRYCWIRDATFTLDALMTAGFGEEARAWRDWLLRAAAGHPRELQIMYGIAGERRLEERTLDWLQGYEGSQPVRVGNAAHQQLQLDVYGELIDALFAAERFRLEPNADAWGLQRALLDFLEGAWHQPDFGIWEQRSPPRHYTHSKIMSWVAFDRAIKMVERSGLDGPIERWQMQRDAIHSEVCKKGFDADRNSFVQSYGSCELDAALLLIPHVGFLAANDPRFIGTVAAIERDLVKDGLVRRYRPEHSPDGLAGGEGTFIACSFWLADALALTGRRDEALGLFERLMTLRNDVGLLAEEYDPILRRGLGNFPQAYSHVALVNTANILAQTGAGAASATRSKG